MKFSVIVVLFFCFAIVNCRYRPLPEDFEDEEIDVNQMNVNQHEKFGNIKKNDDFTNKANEKTASPSKPSKLSKSKAKSKTNQKTDNTDNTDYTIMVIYALIILTFSIPLLSISKTTIQVIKSIESRMSFYYRIYMVEEDFLSYMVLQDIKVKYPNYAIKENERWISILIKHKNIFQRRASILLNELQHEIDRKKFLSDVECISKGKLFYEENNVKLSVDIKKVDEYVTIIENINGGNIDFIDDSDLPDTFEKIREYTHLNNDIRNDEERINRIIQDIQSIKNNENLRQIEDSPYDNLPLPIENGTVSDSVDDLNYNSDVVDSPPSSPLVMSFSRSSNSIINRHKSNRRDLNDTLTNVNHERMLFDYQMELRKKRERKEELEAKLIQKREDNEKNRNIMQKMEENTRELTNEIRQNNMREEEKMRIEKDEKLIKKIKTVLLICLCSFVSALFYRYYLSWKDSFDRCIDDYYILKVPTLIKWSGITSKEIKISKYNCEIKRYGFYSVAIFSILFCLVSPGMIYIIVGSIVGLFLCFIFVDKYRLCIVLGALSVSLSVHWVFLYHFRKIVLDNSIYMVYYLSSGIIYGFGGYRIFSYL